MINLYVERRLSSITDMLAGLMNRRGLMERVEPLWRGMIGTQIAFVYIDMDQLKRINDAYGHAAGDFAIRLDGRAIQTIPPSKAVAARIGGNEFAVFLPASDEADVQAFSDAFARELNRLSEAEERAFAVSASVGCIVKTLDELDAIERCIQASDHQMYQIKSGRRSTDR